MGGWTAYAGVTKGVTAVRAVLTKLSASQQEGEMDVGRGSVLKRDRRRDADRVRIDVVVDEEGKERGGSHVGVVFSCFFHEESSECVSRKSSE